MKSKIFIFILCLIFVFSSCVSAFGESLDTPIDISIDDLPISDSYDVISLKANPVTPNNSNGLHKIIIQLIGNYEPVTVDYTYYQGSSSYQYHDIQTSPDWSWICSCGIFALVIFSVFRLIGFLFRKD